MAQEGPPLPVLQTFASELEKVEPQMVPHLANFLGTGQYSADYVNRLQQIMVRYRTPEAHQAGKVPPNYAYFLERIPFLIRHLQARTGIQSTLANTEPLESANTLLNVHEDSRNEMEMYKTATLEWIRNAIASGVDPLLELPSVMRDQSDHVLFALFLFLSGEAGEEHPQVLVPEMLVMTQAFLLIYKEGIASKSQQKRPWIHRIYMQFQARMTQLNINYEHNKQYYATQSQVNFKAVVSGNFNSQPNWNTPAQSNPFGSAALFPSGAQAVPQSMTHPELSSQALQAAQQAFPSAIQPNSAFADPAGAYASDPSQHVSAQVSPTAPEPVKRHTEVDFRHVTSDAADQQIFQELVSGFGIHVQKKIGQGGMGAVYIAENSRMGWTACLKRILAGQDLDALQRFEIEVKTAAALSKTTPGIADHYGFHIVNGNAFLEFELIEGQDEFDISKECIASALTRNPDENQYDVLKSTYQAFQAFMNSKITQVSEGVLHNLLDYYLLLANRNGDSSMKDLTARIRMVIGAKSRKEAFLTLDRVDQDPDLHANLKQLWTAVKKYPVFGKPDQIGDKKMPLQHRVGPSLPQYLSLTKYHGIECPIDGTDARLMFAVMRDVCGDFFPEKELFEFWGSPILSQTRTLQGVAAEGVLHRDLKPDNLMIKKITNAVLVWITNQMLYYSGSISDPKEKKAKLLEIAEKGIQMKKMKVEIMKASKKIQPDVVVIDFGLARPHDKKSRDFLRRISQSQSQEISNEGDARLTEEGALMGTPHFMAPNTTNPPVGQRDDIHADFHAHMLSVLEIFNGAPVGVLDDGGPLSIIVATGIASSAAVKAREHLGLPVDAVGRVTVPRSVFEGQSSELALLEKIQEGEMNSETLQVPLSRVDCNPRLVSFLESHHPEYLDIARRSTYLGRGAENFPEISWEEQTQFLDNWLNPKVEKVVEKEVVKVRKKFRKRYLAALVVAVGVVIGGAVGFKKHRDQERFTQELNAIQLRLDETASAGVNLRNAEYNSAYFEARIADIVRLREMRGEALTSDERADLERREKYYTLMMLKMRYSEAITPYHNLSEDRQKTTRGLRILESSRSSMEELMRYYTENRFDYSGPVDETHQIPNNMISLPTRGGHIEPFALEKIRLTNIRETLRTFSEFSIRTLENNRGKHMQFLRDSQIEEGNIETLLGQHEFLIIDYYVAKMHGFLGQEFDSILKIPESERGLMMKSLIKCYDYLAYVYSFTSNEDSQVDQSKRRLVQQRIGDCLEAICELNMTFGNPDNSLLSANRRD